MKKMRCFLFVFFVGWICSCSSPGKSVLKKTAQKEGFTGGEFFFKNVIASGWRERDSVAVKEILSGNFPAFLKRFVAVSSSFTGNSGKVYNAVLYVSPDYLSVGKNEDFARVPLTPMAGQRIADSFDCFLPTRKIVDLIYHQASIKLTPVPMYIFRDSSVTMWQHHLIIEGQRKGRKGLIAGIKKDLVISSTITADPKPNREAIYGWHKPDGKPIQPLYTGHVNWYADYSHGIRLVYRKIKVNGRWMDYVDVLKDPVLKQLICDEVVCDFYRYEY